MKIPLRHTSRAPVALRIGIVIRFISTALARKTAPSASKRRRLFLRAALLTGLRQQLPQRPWFALEHSGEGRPLHTRLRPQHPGIVGVAAGRIRHAAGSISGAPYSAPPTATVGYRPLPSLKTAIKRTGTIARRQRPSSASVARPCPSEWERLSGLATGPTQIALTSGRGDKSACEDGTDSADIFTTRQRQTRGVVSLSLTHLQLFAHYGERPNKVAGLASVRTVNDH